MDYTFPLRYTVIVFLMIISDSKANFESECALGKCVAKCCPGNAYIYVDKSNVCVPSATSKGDFSEVDVYDHNLIRTGSLKDSFKIVDGKLFDTVLDISQIPSISAYVLENGNLQLKLMLPNAFPKWQTIKNEHFCMDYLREDNETFIFTPVYSMVWEETAAKNSSYSIATLIISCIFLLLVLIVYLILEELRNLKGKILMAIVSSLLGAFGLLATYQIRRNINAETPIEEECYGFTCSIYFFFLAAFCWMNVMSYDIWWNLRSIMTRTIRVRRGKSRKFMFYCIYAWGLPAAMAVALRLVDQSDLSDRPWIIKPNINAGGCFISGNEKLLYLYVPMMILILSNWILFMMTAVNFWRTKQDVKIIKSNYSNNYLNQKQRFLVYLRLSLIMGLSFVLEVISSFYPDFSFWYITDAYNMFIGVVIFLTFVCKKSIFTKLSKRFQRNRADDNTDTNLTSFSN